MHVLQIPVDNSSTPQHQVSQDDIAAMLKVWNTDSNDNLSIKFLQIDSQRISELTSQVMMLKCNADHLEKKLVMLLQELNEYDSEVKVHVTDLNISYIIDA